VETGEADRPDSGVVLEKIVEYFQYWYKHRGEEDVVDMPIPTEICLELLDAADFLQMGREHTCRPGRGDRSTNPWPGT